MFARSAAAVVALAIVASATSCGGGSSAAEEGQGEAYTPTEIRQAFDDQDVPLGDTGLFEGEGHVRAAFIATDPATEKHTNFSVVVYADSAIADEFDTPDAAPAEEETEIQSRANVVVYFPPSISSDGRRAIEDALDSLP
jgi:hypothetical protein